MLDVPELIDGYHRFMGSRYPEQAKIYRKLAEEGQTPRVMIIACCDSRADPTSIFDAGPGELFIVRNVANLVPPYEPLGDFHGTSAALEFAVTGLGVETILVMGHGRCGGVRAFIDGLYDQPSDRGFIGSWMSLLNVAKGDAMRMAAEEKPEVLQRLLEQASVRNSIVNLRTFPFIREREERGELRLRGAYFDISDGILFALDYKTSAFVQVE